MRLTDRPAADAPPEPAEPAFLAVYRATVHPLYAFVARRAGGSRELTEDVVQETYLRAVEAWSAGRPPREPLPWLQTLARNLLVDFFRRHRPRLVDPGVLADAIDPERPATTPRAVALIQQGLADLPERHARLVEAFHLDGCSVRAIATAHGLSERAVEGRLRRARAALKARLEPLVARPGDSP